MDKEAGRPPAPELDKVTAEKTEAETETESVSDGGGEIEGELESTSKRT